MDTKAWFKSKTIWGAIIAAVAPLLSVFNIHLPPELQAQLTDTVVLAITAVGAVLTVVGRVTASKGIGKPKVPPGPAMAILLALASAPAFTACASLEAETPAQKVYALHSEYAAAAHLAVAYVESDAADPDIKRSIADASAAAKDALDAAEDAVRAGDSPVIPALIAAARHAVEHLDDLVRRTRAPPAG